MSRSGIRRCSRRTGTDCSKAQVAEQFFSLIVQQARRKRSSLSDEHFTVDGTLIEAWAGLKSFQQGEEYSTTRPPRQSNDELPREKRSNETHESTPDPEAKLARKRHGARNKTEILGPPLTENRNGLVVDVRLTRQASGTAERDAGQRHDSAGNQNGGE